MAGAVAFVFGLCALSFAAGCVVTVVMLRHSDPVEEAPHQLAPPEPDPDPPFRLSLPSDEVAAKPIHRNPVVGRPAPVALEPADAAPAVLALVPDLSFTGVFDPPPARLPVAVAELPVAEAPDEPLGGELPREEPVVAEPRTERSFAALPNNGRANWVRVDPWTGRSLCEEQELLLEAARTPVARNEAEPKTVRVVAGVEAEAGPEAAEREDLSTPDVEPVHEMAALSFPTARNGQRREVELELVARPELSPRTEPEPAAEWEPVVAEAGPEVTTSEVVVRAAASVEVVSEPVVVPEADTVFASRSGAVAEPDPARQPEPAAKAGSDAVVPEQGVTAEPVVPKWHVVPNDEFRKRYLRTFEAARRRSNH